MKARYEHHERMTERWNRLFTVLAATPRRELICSLTDRSPSATVPLPASATSRTVLPDPTRLERALIHRHLPMMADLELVEWGREPFVASRGPRFHEIETVMAGVRSVSDELPDSLVRGCPELELQRQDGERT